MKRAVGMCACLALISAACQSAARTEVVTQESALRVTSNFDAQLSEDPVIAASLRAALSGFLSEAESGALSAIYVEPSHREQNSFFFDGFKNFRKSRHADVILELPSVLKSYSFDGGQHYITLAFSGLRGRERFLNKVVELKAVPHEDSYRFVCLFEEKTAHLQQSTIGDVTFYYLDVFDPSGAARFVDFKASFSRLTRVPAAPLRYYKFGSLDALLKAHGLLFDRKKCNFLSNDLGFGDDGGSCFITGMNRESNLRDYVYAHLKYRMPNREDQYLAVKEGVAVHYGNTWGGVTLAEMKAKFRAELEARPDLDFLAEFKKGRGASVESHFSHYFMCALFCDELIKRGEFDEVLELLYSGNDGERFFANLEKVLGITTTDFHASVLRRLQT